MHTAAKDAKLQVEFNPTAVKSHHLVDYESRLPADKDFNDDIKGAGEIGVGHSVTAISVGSSSGAGGIGPLKCRSGAHRIGKRSQRLPPRVHTPGRNRRRTE